MKKTYDLIFKYDTKGKARVWFMEQDGDKYKTIAGVKDGNLVESEWTKAEPTNVGRSNERDGVQQATFEIEAAYEKKLTREYHKTLDAAGGGAHFFKPMLAHKYESFDIGYAQPKLDGIRCIATAQGLFSREGKPIKGVPHIEALLEPTFGIYPDLILDGELYNHDLKDDFNAIVSAVKKATPNAEQKELAKKVQYHVYDMPSLGQHHFGARWDALCKLVNDIDEPGVKLVETRVVNIGPDYEQLHGEWLERGYEGSMWRADEPYKNGRSNGLLKRKEFLEEEFKLLRIEEGLGNWSGVAKRAVCALPDGREFGAGIKGTKERAAELLHEEHHVASIRFFAYTPDGIPRFPVAVKFWGKERTL
jgi:DNA ligase-1